MRYRLIACLALLLIATCFPPAAAAQPAGPDCGAAGKAYTRTTLYFGLKRLGGIVTEGMWQAFLRQEITRRFPAGLTVWEAAGQWRRPDGRINKERAKVVLIVHDDTAETRARIGEVVGTYKRIYRQDSVLWETASVCAAF